MYGEKVELHGFSPNPGNNTLELFVLSGGRIDRCFHSLLCNNYRRNINK